MTFEQLTSIVIAIQSSNLPKAEKDKLIVKIESGDFSQTDLDYLIKITEKEKENLELLQKAMEEEQNKNKK